MKYLLVLIMFSSAFTSQLPYHRIDLEDDTVYKALLSEKSQIIIGVTAQIKKAFAKFSPVLDAYSNKYSLDQVVAAFGEQSRYLKVTHETLNIPYEDLLLSFAVYDFVGCTSAVIRDRNDNLFIGRNLDFGLQEILSELFLNIDFYRNGEFQYSTIHLLGFGQLMNATRPGEYSLSLNKRAEGYEVSLQEALLNFNIPTVYALSYVVEKAKTYDEAVRLLSRIEMTSPAYLIVASSKHKARIIERNQSSVNQVISLNTQRSIVATNFDEEESCSRRDLTYELIEHTPIKSINLTSIMKVMRHKAVHRSATIYSVAINIETGETASILDK